MCTQTGAIVPDAAKPQHFCLEVEARFRDSSRFHALVLTGGLRRRKSEAGARLTGWLVIDLMETLPAKAPEGGTT
jgi:hypothetical protein